MRINLIENIYYINQKCPRSYEYAHRNLVNSREIDPNLVQNVIVLDKDFNIIWSDYIDGIGSLENRPVVVDGKLFIETYLGLFVYDALTGERIGGTSAISAFFSHPYFTEYNGMFIFEVKKQSGSECKTWLAALRP